MRILFLHLSDLHLESQECLPENHIREIAAALSPASIGPVDKIFIFVTGDIAYSGQAEQYKSFSKFKAKLRGKLSPKQVSQIETKFFPQANRSATLYQRKLEERKNN